MKEWNTPAVEELSVAETMNGAKPEFPLDGDYTDKGYPLGANS